ncbi:MAG: GGDEF domain-containing protein [Desulfovibrio sp.]|nr:GGDEF domain-containing protein [Desulfovibrio sp.]
MISLIAAVGLIYIFLIDPVIEEATGITSTLFFRIFYPVFDFGILFGCMVIFFNTEREGLGRQSPLLMILGFIIMFIGDQINLLNELHHFTDIRYIEPIWSLAFCVLGISCIASAEEKSSKNKITLSSSIEKINIIEIVRTLFPYFITFSLLFFIFVHYELYNFSFCWAMFLVFILSIRQFFVLMNNKKLNSELQKLNIKIMEDAKIDFLTKIANRRHINDVLKDLDQEKTITRLGLLFIDLDNFKKINDTYGHDGGDAVLQGVANAIRQSLRETDVAGRFGGDEFIAILPGADSSAVASVGERIREHVRLDGKLSSWNVTLSIGGASSVSRNINLLMKTADLALYEAKEGGKNRLVIAREPQEVAKTA